MLPTTAAPPSSSTARSPSCRSAWPTRRPRWPRDEGARRLLKEEVDADDIARIVAAWTGIPVARLHGGRAGQAHPHGGAAARARGRPGRGHLGRVRRRAAAPAPASRTPSGPSARSSSWAPPAWARPRLARALAAVPLRRRGRHDPHRHERVHGEVRGQPADRRAAGLRRLRGGRPAHRGRPAPALPGHPARRDREGPPRRLQRAAAGARRRPPDRRPGPRGARSRTPCSS